MAKHADTGAQIPDRPTDDMKQTPGSGSGFGTVMSDAKKNVTDMTPWWPAHDTAQSPTTSDGLGAMADGVGATREKTMQPSMPPKGDKAPWAT